MVVAEPTSPADDVNDGNIQTHCFLFTCYVLSFSCPLGVIRPVAVSIRSAIGWCRGIGGIVGGSRRCVAILVVVRGCPVGGHSIRSRHAMLVIPSLAVLGIAVADTVPTSADVCLLSLVTLANLVRRRVCGQPIGISSVDGIAVAPEEPAETAAAVARCVVIGRRGAEALFFLTVTTESKFSQGGDYEKDTIEDRLVGILFGWSWELWGKGWKT